MECPRGEQFCDTCCAEIKFFTPLSLSHTPRPGQRFARPAIPLVCHPDGRQEAQTSQLDFFLLKARLCFPPPPPPPPLLFVLSLKIIRLMETADEECLRMVEGL